MSEKKSLLIVKSETNSLVSTEQFLRNRGWQVLSTVKPFEAITLLAKYQPTYLLISVNHPNKKIQGLVQSITQTFRCVVIMFAEHSDASSFKMLTEARPMLVIYPPMTGPAVERAINKSINGYQPADDVKSLGPVIISQRAPVDTRLETVDDSLVMTKKFQESVVFHATRDVLAKTTLKGGVKASVSMEYANEVVCIAINSSDCSGYLVIAAAGDLKLDEKFIRQLKIHLVSALNKRDENITTDKDMHLSLSLVPFQDWAVQSAEFLRKSVHANGEVAMAFFRNTSAITEFEASERSNMCTVGLKYIQPDAVVKCNLYLYLESNERYILYTPRGSKIYGNQIEKLKQQGVDKMHILIEDTHQFNVYRAEGFLNDSIKNFQLESEL